MDAIAWRLLKLLQENARMPFRQLGEMVGLTAPAAAERIHRLEDSGIVTGYRADIDLAKVGLPIMAFVHLMTTNSQSTRLRKEIATLPEVLECYCVTGTESYILKVVVTSVPHLEHLLLMLKIYGEMRTSLVLSSQVKARPIDESMTQYDVSSNHLMRE
jgi:Lrp/AsnC family transcriptional regulator, leucine-responsive regulatory protein